MKTVIKAWIGTHTKTNGKVRVIRIHSDREHVWDEIFADYGCDHSDDIFDGKSRRENRETVKRLGYSVRSCKVIYDDGSG